MIASTDRVGRERDTLELFRDAEPGCIASHRATRAVRGTGGANQRNKRFVISTCDGVFTNHDPES